jgi:hypothetical protein
MNKDERVLWTLHAADSATACVMVSCCAGAELQIVRSTAGDEQIVLRELYPDRDSLYERARELRKEMAQGSSLRAQGTEEFRPEPPEP